MFSKLTAFMRGIIECRSDLTTSYDDLADLEWYDTGRALARWIVDRT